MDNRGVKGANRVKAIIYTITIPCGPHHNEQWARGAAFDFLRNLPKKSQIRWEWESEKNP